MHTHELEWYHIKQGSCYSHQTANQLASYISLRAYIDQEALGQYVHNEPAESERLECLRWMDYS